MRHTLFIVTHLVFFLYSSHCQLRPNKAYPVLSKNVQTRKIFENSKTFLDCVPLIPANKIDSCYITESAVNGFSLNDFISTYFVLPESIELTSVVDTSLQISENLKKIITEITVQPKELKGSFIELPFPYVSAGTNKELLYWDSYFIMLGLAKLGEVKLMEQIVGNFAYLIDSFGFIPSGNRSYYLSRSQPPFFCLMLDLLSEATGDPIWEKYLPHLVKEYEFWMNGKSELSITKSAIKRVVLLPDGEVLNRYWDNLSTPRPESFVEDIEIARHSAENDSMDFRNIRAACESGWNFSSRWLNDGQNLSTIETTKIIPVDLNCLLLLVEETLSNIHENLGNKKESKRYANLAKERKKSIEKYFWRKNEGFYVDYHFKLEWQNMPNHLAGMFPLFLSVAPKSNAKEAVNYLKKQFLNKDGLTTTSNTTGLDWDSPFGSAPLHHISIVGLRNYGYEELANHIEKNWIKLNLTMFQQSGLFFEKYNVINNYPKSNNGIHTNPDKPGWTVGILLHLLKE